jgi:two-component system sporulation sensor kinase A
VVIYDEEGGPHAILATYRDITERKQMEWALRESERRYHRLVDTAPDVIYTISWDGTLTSLNPAFEKITGWSRNEWLNKPFAGLVHPDDLAKAVETFQQTMRGEAPPPYELRIRTKSGDYLMGEFTSKPLIEKGEVIGELGITRDITERKRAEDALKESEDRYRSLVETSPDAVTMTDLEGRVIYVSPQTLELHGFKSAEELVGRSALDIIAPEDREKAMINLQRTLKEGVVRRLEYALLKKDGTRFIGSLNAALIKDTHGKPKAFVAITWDITERKLAEEALQEAEKRYRTLFEHSPSGILLIDPKTAGIIEFNDITCSQLGYSRDEFAKLQISDFDALETPQDTKARITKILREGKDTFETKHRAKDGKLRDILVIVQKTRISGKDIFHCIFHDITERKTAEDQLEEYSEKLEQKVQEKTEELLESHKKLVMTERLATIGEVATQVGHDLRNPLTSIKGAAYYLKMDKNIKLDKNAIKMLDTIDDSIAYSDKIITDLLDFSQEIKLKTVRKTVRDIVTDAISSLTVPKKVNVINSIESEPTIRTDSLLIRRVLHNILINAFDAMPDGGTLKIESKKNGENVSIRICDSGVGMPKNVIEKVFTPFFTTKARGVGLGLAICKRIVEAHEGFISVESKKGKGTCVTIILPKNKR